MARARRSFGILPAALIAAVAGLHCTFLASSDVGLGVGKPCTPGASCHAGLCENGVCTASCNTDAECPAPSVCLTTPGPGRCRVGCRADAECGNAAQVCEAGVCQPGCTADTACPTGQSCVNRTCKPGCTDDTRCPAGQACIVNPDCPDGQTCAKECRPNLTVAAVFAGAVDGQDSWSTSHKLGLDNATTRFPYAKFGTGAYQFTASARKVEDITKAIDQYATAGAKVIITTSPDAARAAREVAPRHAGVSFLTAGEVSNDGQPNVGAYRVRAEQLWYVAGWMASRVATSGVSSSPGACIGMILPTPTKEAVRETNAFARGVRRIDTNKRVKVVIRWLGATKDFSDAPSYDFTPTNFIPADVGKYFREELLAAELADLGCRVVVHRTETARVVNAVERRLRVPVEGGPFQHKMYSMGMDLREACREGLTSGGTWQPSCFGVAYWNWGGMYARLFDQVYKNIWSGAVVSEEFRTDADAVMRFEVNPANNTGVDADEVRNALTTISNEGYAGVFKGPYSFNGQRDLGQDGVSDTLQAVGSGTPLNDEELSRMCWFLEGVEELPDPTIRTYASLKPALVPGGLAPVATSTSDGVFTVDEQKPASVKKYDDVIKYLKKINKVPAQEMNCMASPR